MKKYFIIKVVVLTSLIIIIGYYIINLINLSLNTTNINRDIENLTKLTAMNIYNEIQIELVKPVYVSLGMSNNTFVKDWLKNEDYTDDKNINLISNYLKEIKDRFNYSTSFLISSESKNYYTSDGIFKNIDTSTDEHDVWYFSFINQINELKLDVDTDQVNSDKLSIFVNVKVLDENSDLLGVIGVGLEMSKLQDKLYYFNHLFGVETFIINEEGIIQIHTNDELIEQNSVYWTNLYNKYKNNILLKNDDFGIVSFKDEDINYFLVSRYIKELNWYIISMKDTFEYTQSYKRQSFWNAIIILFVLLGVLFITIKLILYFQSKLLNMSMNAYSNKSNNKIIQDINFDKTIEHYKNNSLPISLFILNVDNFKNINSIYGASFGNKILKNIISIITETINNKNNISRCGGDEFIGIIEKNQSDSILLLEKLLSTIKNNTLLSKYNVTVSIGLSEIIKFTSMEKIIYEVYQLLYLAKERGKNQIVYK